MFYKIQGICSFALMHNNLKKKIKGNYMLIKIETKYCKRFLMNEMANKV